MIQASRKGLREFQVSVKGTGTSDIDDSEVHMQLKPLRAKRIGVRILTNKN
jgi:hypothetical protein